MEKGTVYTLKGKAKNTKPKEEFFLPFKISEV